MKSILYVVAIVLSCAAGYFSYTNKGKQEDQLSQTEDANKKNANLQASIKKAQRDLKSENALYSTAVEAEAEIKAGVESAQSDIALTTRSIAPVKSAIAGLDEDLEKYKQAQKSLQDNFKEQNIPLEGIPEFMEKLENDRKQLAKQNEELAAASQILTNQVNKNRETLGELERRSADRTASLRGNAAASLITAVNNSWGFVIIKPHASANITEESKLIVVRGARHVGRLKINSIEPNRIIADIDYDSLAPGVRIQPGDKVILAVANTR